MIAYMRGNKNLNPIITELLIRSRKINISLPFITEHDFVVPKTRLNSKQMRTLTIRIKLFIRYWL